jgi:L-fuculose-phosphate aldolase
MRMTTEAELRSELVRYGRMMFDRGLTYATGGNISVRLDDETLLITPSGVRKGEMGADQLLVVDMEGRVLGEGRPSIETPLHTAFYAREDVNAVVHGHPPFCTSLAVMGEPLRTALIPEGILVLGDVPLVPYRTPGSVDLAEVMTTAGGDGKGYLMERHGALTVGDDLERAYNRLEEMEFIAMVQVRCMCMGEAEELPEEERGRILDI